MRSSSASTASVLALLSCCALLFGCTSAMPVAINENTVYSPPLHLTVTKPANWTFVSWHDIREAQKHVHSTNQTYNYIVYQSATVPFVSIERNDRDGAFINFYRESLEDERLATSERVVRLEMGAYVNVITGARVVAPIVDVTIGGQRYATSRIRYPYSVRKGSPHEIERQFWVRATGISAVVISASYEANAADRVRAEIEEILHSVTMDSPKNG